MANLQIQIKNANKIMKAFRDAPVIMAKNLQDAILKVGGFTTGEVKNTITAGTEMWKPPILTGALRRGIQIRQTDKLKVIISPSDITPYALFVHEGTKFMRARPFFEITARTKKDKIGEFFNKALETAVNQIANEAK